MHFEGAFGLAIMVLFLLCGAYASLALRKAHSFLGSAEMKNHLAIIDEVTDRAVEYVEATLKDVKGSEKLALAIKVANEILESKGITITETEVIAGIENGVNKIKTQQQFLADISGFNLPPQ